MQRLILITASLYSIIFFKHTYADETRCQVCMDIDDAQAMQQEGNTISQGRPGKRGIPGAKGDIGPPGVVDYEIIFSYIEQKMKNESIKLRDEICKSQGNPPRSPISSENEGISLYTFFIESAGMDDGNRCKIMINGKEYQNAARGHCVVVYNPQTDTYKAERFDTYFHANNVKRMIRFIEEAEYGSFIAMAVKDASNKIRFDDEDVAYLERLGAGGTSCPVSLEVRDSWSFLTEKVPYGTPLPKWKSCSWVPRYSGRATVNTTVKLESESQRNQRPVAKQNTIIQGQSDKMEIMNEGTVSYYFPITGYPSNQDLKFRITGPESMKLRLEFSHFLLEGYGCIYDYLAIHDGNSVDSSQIGKFCGSQIPTPVVSTGSVAALHFVSDGTIQLHGFKLRVTSVSA